ncbi:MAG: lipopolysaccharide biosynthesis protein [Gaiellaceae bacterium]
MSSDGWGSSLRKGIAWSTITFVIAKAVTFASMLVLARLLAPKEFGAVAAVTVFLAFVELASDLGMKATVQYEQEHGFSDRIQTAFTLNIVLVVILTGVGVLLAPLVAEFFNIPHQTYLFRLGILSLLFTGLGNIHDGLLLRDLSFNRRIVPELVRGVVRGGVAIVFAALGAGAVSIVVGMLAGSAAWTVVQWILTPFRPTFAFDRSIARTMIWYGLGASLLQVITVISQNTDTAAIGRILDKAALGLYTIGYRIPELLIANVGQEISIVAFPALSRKRAEDREGLAPATLSLVRYQALYAIPVAAGLAVLAPPLIVVAFGEKWREAGGVMSAIAVMSGIAMVIYPLGDVFKALAKQRVLVALNCVQLPVLIGAMILAAPSGILAVAWVRAGGMALFAVLFLWQVKRVIVDMRYSELAIALWPAAVTGTGVAIGSGLARLALPGLSVGPLLVGMAAAALCGGIALRASAPDLYREVKERAAQIRLPRARPATRQPQ